MFAHIFIFLKAVHEQKRRIQQTTGLHRLKVSTTHCDTREAYLRSPPIEVDDIVLFLVISDLFCVTQQHCIYFVL